MAIQRATFFLNILKSTIFTEEKKYDINDIKKRVEAGTIEFLTQQETIVNNEMACISSGVWLDFRRMLVPEENTVVENIVFCAHCRTTVAYYGTTTTRLRDHQRKCSKRPLDDRTDNSKSTINFKLEELAQLKESSVKFIVKDVRPFAAIEGEGLLDLIYSGIQLGRKYPRMNEADLKKALPSRNTVVSRVQDMAENSKNLLARKIRNAINLAGKIAATIDAWTEPNNSTKFLSLTVHFFTEEDATLKLECFTADLCETKELSMTGAVIKRAIYDMFAELDLEEEEVRAYVCIVTDRGSNMLVAVDDLDSAECLAHLTNNVVGQMLKNTEVKDILAKASNLVRYMKTSHAGAQLTSKLKSYPETRFNYAYDMLISILTNRNQVFEILEAKEQLSRNKDLTDKVTCLPADKMKSICGFLAFFKELTAAIEGDKHVTLNRVWPALRELRSILQPKPTDCDVVASMKRAGLSYITKPENVRFFEPKMSHKLALFLHPCMNQLPFLNYSGKLCKKLIN